MAVISDGITAVAPAAIRNPKVSKTIVGGREEAACWEAVRPLERKCARSQAPMKRYEVRWTALDLTICPLTTQLHPGCRSDSHREQSPPRFEDRALNANDAARLRRVITEMYGE